MKNILTILIILLGFASMYSQTGNKCHACGMIVQEDSHVSIIVNTEELRFASIECMLGFIKNEPGIQHSDILVANYDNPKELLKAEDAFFLKSEAISSPMGANISAFESLQKAEANSNLKTDKIFDWKELMLWQNSKKLGDSDHSDHATHSHQGSFGPVGVMGDHLHHKGGVMISVSSMNMGMEGNRIGNEEIQNSAIFEDYMVAPQQMGMSMYMLGAMYAPGDRVTLMLMQNFIRKNMDLSTQPMPMMSMDKMQSTQPEEFSTATSGFGDIQLQALVGVFQNQDASLHLHTGFSLPLGNIEQRDNTPMMNDAKLPYAMQLGSGTFDFITGATFKKEFSFLSLGSQFLATIRTGKNTYDYRFGNSHLLNVWGSYPLLERLSISGRLSGMLNDPIIGADADLNPMMVPTANTTNYGGNLVRSFAGLNLTFPRTSTFKDLFIGSEIGANIYEDYNGIQMHEKLTYNLSLKYTLL